MEKYVYRFGFIVEDQFKATSVLVKRNILFIFYCETYSKMFRCSNFGLYIIHVLLLWAIWQM